ncbi:MAG: DUF1015 domain-containing protein [Candidatus Omnitrophica bacterium]|nr:DUF1015 domain-containing protein [Candidatus Omnitrophota bacterium]
MIKIKPFKAVFYNQQKLKDLSALVCPPYDVISPLQQDYYHNLNPYNYIHILLGKDIPGEDKYARAGLLFENWLKNKILIRDTRSAVYFYSQHYNIKGEKKTRLGVIALLGLGDRGSPVFGHEHTRIEAKEDRLNLMRRVNANLSPVFIITKDNQRVIQRLYEQYAKDKPAFIELKDNAGTLHRVWRIDAPEALNMLQSGLQKEEAFIADGHHRYEVSCAYRDEMKQKLGDEFPEEASFNYTLAYFTNTDQRGLSILPLHRLLRLERAVNLEQITPALKNYFDVEEVKDKTRFFFLMEKGGRAEHVLGMYKDKKYWLLRLKNIKILDKLLSDKPKEYRALDVAILNQIIFKDILGYDSVEKNNLSYSPNAEEFIAAVDQDRLSIAFFLNPVKIEQIMAVALSGNKMPAKSTYFYPKVLSGLVINKHDEGVR